MRPAFINQIMFVTPAFNRDPVLIQTRCLFKEILTYFGCEFSWVVYEGCCYTEKAAEQTLNNNLS